MKLSRHWLWAVLLVAPGVGGCAVISWTVAQFKRPKKVKALYELPRNRRVLVLVESRPDDGAYESVQRDLTGFLNGQLLGHKLAREVVPYAQLMAFRASTGDYHSLEVVKLGREFKADMVLCVDIVQFALKDNPEDVLWHGRFAARVRVVKVAEGIVRSEARLWPKGPFGHLVAPVVRDPVADPSPNYGARLARHLASEMADRVAKVFYTHSLTELESLSS